LSNIFVPIIPAIVASGLLMGLLGMVKTYGWVNADNAIYILLDMCSSAAFIILPILIGFTAAREFGGNPYLGATLGGILTHPALTNAWGVAAGFQTMNFFGFEIAMIGYQGTVFPVLLAVWFMSIVEKQLRRFIPDALDLILTPFLTVVISGFIALLIIGPAGRALGDGISFVLSTLIAHAGWLAGLLFGGLYSAIVITGIHHSFHAIEAGLLGNPAIGVNFLLPIWAMANVAQGGACLAVWFKTKDTKIKAITLPSAFSAMLGITEAAIFGINLRFVKPFIAALIGGAAGGAWVVSVHVYMTAVGLTAIPGMAIVQPTSLVNYIIGMVIAFAVAFSLSLLLKYKTDEE
ncbi:TPA: maltose/glucose-specific PTS transporter subunit IIC, partial [Escherichia coli]